MNLVDMVDHLFLDDMIIRTEFPNKINLIVYK